MKTLTCLGVAIGLFAVALLCGVIALYTAGALAAAQTVRPLPFVGPLAADRIERWVLGAVESNVIEDAPFIDSDVIIDNGDYYDGPIEERTDCQTPMGLPVWGPIRSGFRPPDRPNHTGVDISVVVGTPVAATMCGTVVFAGWSDVGYGYLVILQNGNVQTYYAHNSVLLISTGSQVEAGQIVAESGNTGNSTGPHVHYEVRVDGIAIDPLRPMP